MNLITQISESHFDLERDKMNAYYLVIVMVWNNGITVEKIPQVNSAQCQVNAKAYNSVKYAHATGGVVKYKTHCIVGLK